MLADSFQQSANSKSKRSHFFTSLKLKRRIDHLFKNGRKSFGRYLMLRFDSNENDSMPLRVVFAVSSRLGPATVRNRIKRRLREALFLTLKAGRANPSGFDIAIVPRKEVAELDFEELCDDLRQALHRVTFTGKNTQKS